MDAVKLERCTVAIIAILTIATGAAQIAIPNHLLPLLAIDPTALGAHLLATVGMFMMLFGGLVLHARKAPDRARFALLWGGLQKFGAAIFVAWGVSRGVLVPLALAVAAFDFLSALLFLDLRRRGG